MQKAILILLLSPFLMATQCNIDDEVPCAGETDVITESKLVTIENLQETYNVGDILWINSELQRNMSFTDLNEPVDLFNYNELMYHFNLHRLSVFDSGKYLCVNENTLEVDQGEHITRIRCNYMGYAKNEDSFSSRVGIKLLESGNFSLVIKEISMVNTECDQDDIDVITTFSNDDVYEVFFSVE